MDHGWAVCRHELPEAESEFVRPPLLLPNGRTSTAPEAAQRPHTENPARSTAEPMPPLETI
ncbi:hypothetical protein [Streptomyces sp. NPDC093707]|uniref:hypothetical protein n=1 Tax=Streptomyces sp. NPDC093707 TaxID=3154984 RepID=UPI00344F7951